MGIPSIYWRLENHFWTQFWNTHSSNRNKARQIRYGPIRFFGAVFLYIHMKVATSHMRLQSKVEMNDKTFYRGNLLTQSNKI